MILITTTTILSFFVFYNHKKLSKIFNIYDYPDKKLKNHKIKTSSAGGIFIFLLFFLILLIDQIFKITKIEFFSSILELNLFLFFCGIFLIFGIIDDKIKLKANLKLFIFIFTFIIFCFLSNNFTLNYFYTSLDVNNFNLGIISIPFSIFCYLSFTQAFNMYDGLDKQSGFLILIYLIVFLYLSNYSFFFIYLLIPIIFFILFNKKGQIFLGNAGSNFLSFFIAVVSIRFAENNLILAEQIFILFAIPGYELIRLSFIRITGKKNPLVGDLNHIHHLLMAKLNYIQTLILILGLTLFPVIGIFLNIEIYLIIIVQLISYAITIIYCKAN
tara:strand:+ start:1173 stop:2159 length:987 start_codon:yes stop_codon:yes gene_type:complete